MGVGNMMMESWTEITCVIISSLATIFCAYIAHKNDKVAKETEIRSRRRIKESMLSLKLMNANCELSVGTALAVKRGYANGELEEGLKKVKEAQTEYENFLQSIAVEDMVQDK